MWWWCTVTCHYGVMHGSGKRKSFIMPLYERSALKEAEKGDKMKEKCLWDISGEYVQMLWLYPGEEEKKR